MTLDQIRAEMALIREQKKTDIEGARERWKSLNERLRAFIAYEKLPSIWANTLLEEIKKI